MKTEPIMSDSKERNGEPEKEKSQEITVEKEHESELEAKITCLQKLLQQTQEKNEKLTETLTKLQDEAQNIGEERIKSVPVFQKLLYRAESLTKALDETNRQHRNIYEELNLKLINTQETLRITLKQRDTLASETEQKLAQANTNLEQLKTQYQKEISEAQLSNPDQAGKDFLGDIEKVLPALSKSLSDVRSEARKAFSMEVERHKADVIKYETIIAENQKEKEKHVETIKELRAKIKILENPENSDAGDACEAEKMDESENTLSGEKPECPNTTVEMSPEEQIRQLKSQIIGLETELASIKEESAIYSEELDRYDVSNKNLETRISELLSTIQAKEKTLMNAVTEKHKSQQLESLARKKVSEIESALASQKEKNTAQSELLSKLEEKNKLQLEALVKYKEERASTQSMIEEFKKQQENQVLSYFDMKKRVDEADYLRHTRDELQKQVHSEEKKRHSLEEKLSQKTEKLKVLKKQLKGTQESAGESEELEYYRNYVRCKVCSSNAKGVYLVNCGHTFCKECVERSISTRSRKCPDCRAPFDRQDIRTLY